MKVFLQIMLIVSVTASLSACYLDDGPYPVYHTYSPYYVPASSNVVVWDHYRHHHHRHPFGPTHGHYGPPSVPRPVIHVHPMNGGGSSGGHYGPPSTPRESEGHYSASSSSRIRVGVH